MIWVSLLGGADRCLAAPTLPITFTDVSQVAGIADPFINGQLARWHAPGAVFVLVADGRVIYVKGYGWADIERQIPMDPARTVFPVGSLSKLITATAAMQLAERGKIDLHADVNQYLRDFQLEGNFPAPVTMAELLTHTAGLEDSHIGMRARTPGDVMPLGQYLARWTPRRFAPPNVFSAYCNEDYALAGYIVQVRSGESFADYAEHHIFTPLGMYHSTFHQPPPPEMTAKQAIGYAWKRGRFVPKEEFYVHDVPAAAMRTTGADMARFLIAQLDTAHAGGILDPMTLADMHRVQFKNSPHTSGAAYGFHVDADGVQPRLEHGGMSLGYMSKVVLLPEQHAGFFVAYNMIDVELLAELDMLFRPANPGPPASPPPASAPTQFPASSDDLARFAGFYRPVAFPRGTIEKIDAMVRQVRVRVNSNGELILHKNDHDAALVLRGPGWFERADVAIAAEFRFDAAGRVQYLFYGSDAFEKLPWYLNEWVQKGLIGFFGITFPISLVWLKGNRPEGDRTGQWARRLARTVASMNIIFILGFAVLLGTVDYAQFLYAPYWPMRSVLFVGFTAGVLALLLPLLTVAMWVRRSGSLGGRLRYSAFTAIALAFVAFLHYWNLAAWPS